MRKCVYHQEIQQINIFRYYLINQNFGEIKTEMEEHNNFGSAHACGRLYGGIVRCLWFHYGFSSFTQASIHLVTFGPTISLLSISGGLCTFRILHHCYDIWINYILLQLSRNLHGCHVPLGEHVEESVSSGWDARCEFMRKLFRLSCKNLCIIFSNCSSDKGAKKLLETAASKCIF